MIVKYTGFPMEPRHPAFKNEPTSWMPVLTVRLGKGHDLWSPRFGAVVDSGSPFCMFPNALADFLHINVTDGTESIVGGILRGETEPIYFHSVNLQITGNWCISVKAGFTRKLAVAGILGRNGFFDNFTVKFDHSVAPPQFEIEKIPLIQ
jgi:hypothetical protein